LNGLREGICQMIRPIIVIAGLALCVSGCSKDETRVLPNDPSAALKIVKDYAETHYPKGTFQPDGARLHYHLTDEGDFWRGGLGPDGYAGGGLEVMIRKHDMKVIKATLTQ